jgi:hypothetical protein
VWARLITGAVFFLTGVVWIAQGTGALGGSGMSGHRQWAVIGVVVIVIGSVLLVQAWRIRRTRMGGTV